MRVKVIKQYNRPYENPISVAKGEPVTPNLAKETKIKGWVWCTARDGRSGWTPRDWLVQIDGAWCVNHEFDAIELTGGAGEILDASFEKSGFFWASTQSGEAGWVPCENVSVIQQT